MSFREKQQRSIKKTQKNQTKNNDRLTIVYIANYIDDDVCVCVIRVCVCVCDEGV